MIQENNKEEDLKELVLARIDVMPSNFKLSVGNFGTFTKNEIKEHIQKGDDAGKQIIRMQLNFIKALSNGMLIEALNKQ